MNPNSLNRLDLVASSTKFEKPIIVCACLFPICIRRRSSASARFCNASARLFCARSRCASVISTFSAGNGCILKNQLIYPLITLPYFFTIIVYKMWFVLLEWSYCCVRFHCILTKYRLTTTIIASASSRVHYWRFCCRVEIIFFFVLKVIILVGGFLNFHSLSSLNMDSNTFFLSRCLNTKSKCPDQSQMTIDRVWSISNINTRHHKIWGWEKQECGRLLEYSRNCYRTLIFTWCPNFLCPNFPPRRGNLIWILIINYN